MEESSQPFQTGKRYAFLVGVNEYEDSWNFGELPFCARDAHRVRNALSAAGYEGTNIDLVTDEKEHKPTRANILHRFQALARRTTRDDTLLFYYSGHGEADSKDSYLVARDGRFHTLPDTGVRLSRILDIMRGAPAAKCIVVLDACFSGGDLPRKSARKMSLQFIQNVFDQAQGMILLSSCTRDETSFLWMEKRCSVFTYYLLRALKSNPNLNEGMFVSVQDVNRIVKDGVDRWARKHGLQQTPTIWGAMAGDMLLADFRDRENKGGGKRR